MHNVHPAIIEFAKYCHSQGIDLLELPQQYAEDNPLSYGNYLMAHFDTTDVVDCAEQMGWDISEHPDIVIKIASEISRSADPDYGINWDTFRTYTKEVYKAASLEIQALAEGGKLKNPYTGEDEEHEEDDEVEGGEEYELDPPDRYGDYAD